MRRVFAVSMSALVASMSSIGLCAPLLTSFSSVLKGLQHELHSIISPRVPELSFELPNNLGSVHPLDLGNGALRLTLPFAEAPLGDLRFANPQPLKTLSPDFDATKAAPSCFQGSTQPRGGATPSEDCLYMTVYLPNSLDTSRPLPILIWLPGGSFIGGSASASGLDGAKMATEQKMIVAFVQYRLGAFGWLQTKETLDETGGGAPCANKVAGNQAARDVTAALHFVQQHFGALGADTKRITLSGQSSGAQMVRSLLTVPEASTLFQQALIISDTQNYGPATQGSQNKMGNYVLKALNCSDIACARSKSAEEVLDASCAAFSDVPSADGSLAVGSPWRPTQGQWMPHVLEEEPAAAFSSGAKKIVLTTISNEAGATAGSLFAKTTAHATELRYAHADNTSFPLAVALDRFFNQGRGDAMMKSSAYSKERETFSGTDDGLRTMLEIGATDGLWRCPTQRNAHQLASHGSVWLAEHMLGYTYPSNSAVSYCRASDKHCHEDDIYLIFGTLPGDSNHAQRAFSKELRHRYGAFVRNGNPNALGYAQWDAIDGSSTSSLKLLQGGSQSSGSSTIARQQRPEMCGPLWGSSIYFDWQLYS